jgi:hypothetical protein
LIPRHRALSASTLPLLVAALLGGACGPRKCFGPPIVRIVFTKPLPGATVGQGDTVEVRLGTRSFEFPCPNLAGNRPGGAGVICGYEAIEMTIPGLDIYATTEAVITITSKDGTVLAKDYSVTLMPVDVGYPDGDSDTCARVGEATL